MEVPFDQELEVAQKAARRAAELAVRHQRAGLRPQIKDDGSPVTAADRECERLILSVLEETFPEDGLLGEEGSAKPSVSGRRWIVDPIDGTRDFVRGNPLWATLIGLEAGGVVQAGVAHLPMLDRMYFASRGGGAWSNGASIRVSGVASPEQAVLSMNSFNRIGSQPFAGRLFDWMSRFWAVRSLGGCLDAMLLAEGRIDIWMEPRVAEWDLAAPQVIIEEAGGAFFDFRGEHTIYGGTAVGCTPALAVAVRRLLGLQDASDPAH